MKTYVLLHGAWHASWCWERVAPLLQAAGHIVVSPDLPGHGDDQIPFAEISLETYVSFVVELILALNRPVVLVGHSMAGIILSQVAEKIPDCIECLVYISAFIPAHQQTLLDTAKQLRRTRLFIETKIDSLNQVIELNKTKAIYDLFFNASLFDDVDDILNRLCLEPFRPFLEPLQLSKSRFGQVKKYYVVCLEDRTIHVKDQYKMLQEAECVPIELATDHSPFYSMPNELGTIFLTKLRDFNHTS